MVSGEFPEGDPIVAVPIFVEDLSRRALKLARAEPSIPILVEEVEERRALLGGLEQRLEADDLRLSVEVDAPLLLGQPSVAVTVGQFAN